MFGYSVRRIICGMRDNIQIEAISNQSGDVPNQTGVDLQELPEAPTAQIEAKKVVEKELEKRAAIEAEGVV